MTKNTTTEPTEPADNNASGPELVRVTAVCTVMHDGTAYGPRHAAGREFFVTAVERDYLVGIGAVQE